MAAIGFVGLGNMGAPMAANLLKAGHAVRGHDLNPAACAALREAGGTIAASLAEIAAAEVVITMLPAGAHVRAVLTDVLVHARPGTLLIDSSTIDVETTRALHAAARQAGCAMLDAPVSGGVGGATAGTLTFMVGGATEEFARAQPVLSGMGRTIVHCGDAGCGQAAKACNNMVLAISMIGVCEAFALADRLGLSAQALFDVVSKSSGQCWSLTNYCPVPGPVPAAPSNHGYAAGFTAALMLKDLSLATGAAAAAGQHVPLGDHAARLFGALVEAGYGAKDFSVMMRAVQANALPA